MTKNTGLGKGLDALIGDRRLERKPNSVISSSINEIGIELIQANPFQPRNRFDEELLNELCNSIKQHGIIQPLTVRKVDENVYQLISGERRLKASKLAGLEKVPCYVRDAEDSVMLELALIENIQRADLNPIEIAISYQRLIDECDMTHELLSERVSKSRSNISNYLRLLKLPAEIQIGCRDGLLGVGHARALITIDDPQKQIDIYFRIVNEGLSVRQVEEILRASSDASETRNKRVRATLPQQYIDFKKNLSTRINTKVELKRYEDGKGKIVIPFESDDDLARIISEMAGNQGQEQ